MPFLRRICFFTKRKHYVTTFAYCIWRNRYLGYRSISGNVTLAVKLGIRKNKLNHFSLMPVWQFYCWRSRSSSRNCECEQMLRKEKQGERPIRKTQLTAFTIRPLGKRGQRYRVYPWPRVYASLWLSMSRRNLSDKLRRKHDFPFAQKRDSGDLALQTIDCVARPPLPQKSLKVCKMYAL